MYVPTLREHNLVSRWISLVSHCYPSVAKVLMCKAKNHLVVFNSQIIQSFTTFLFHWLCGSLWSDTVDRAFIKGCWIIMSVHICNEVWVIVRQIAWHTLSWTSVTLCRLSFAHLFITLPLFNAMQEYSLNHTKKTVCAHTFSTPCIKMGLILTL